MIKNRLNKKYKKRNGFTLIELLFVIAIIAIMTSVGISMFKQKSRNSSAEIIAIKIQQIQQAASNIYTNLAYWPKSSYGLPSEIKYFPVNWKTFPVELNLGYASTNSEAIEQKFRVCVAMNNGKIVSEYSPLLQKVAALLPNAIYYEGKHPDICTVDTLKSDNPCVCAEIVAPKGGDSVAIGAKGKLIFNTKPEKKSPVNPDDYKKESKIEFPAIHYKCPRGYDYHDIQVLIGNYNLAWQNHPYTTTKRMRPVNLSFQYDVKDDRNKGSSEGDMNVIFKHKGAILKKILLNRNEEPLYVDSSPSGSSYEILERWNMLQDISLDYVVYCCSDGDSCSSTQKGDMILDTALCKYDNDFPNYTIRNSS